MTTHAYIRIAETLKVKPTKLILDILETIAGSEESALLNMLPATPDQLAEKIGKPVDEIKARCQQLYEKGLALKSFGKGVLSYRMHKDITMFRDATGHWP